MRIVYVSPVGQVGGAEALLLDLLASMRAARPEWSLHLIVPEAGKVADRASRLGVNIHVVAMPRSVARLGDSGVRSVALAGRILRALAAGLFYRDRLARQIASLKPDVVHSNGFKMHLMSVWTRPKNAAVFWHIHDFVSARPLMARVVPRLASRCSAAIADSESVAKDLRALCPKLAVTTVLNAIDLDEFSAEGAVEDLDALSSLPKVDGVVRVGLVATMAKWKGHAVFIEAMSKIAKDVPLRGYIIGGAIYQSDGSQWRMEELRGLVARLGMEDRIGFTGFLDRPAGAIRALDIVVHASTRPEPFGLAIAEGMACGKAVIASALGGPSEFLDDGVNGLAHRAGDPDDLADKVERLARDAAYRGRLGLAARETAVRLFDRGRLAAETIAVYESAGSRATAANWAVRAVIE